MGAFTGVNSLPAATTQAFGGTHGDTTNDAVTQLLLHFQYQWWPSLINFQCVIDLRNGILRELDVDNRADDLNDDDRYSCQIL
jgi:hypothetical protein